MKKQIINSQKWKDVLAEVSRETTPESYNTWFLHFRSVQLDEDAGIIYLSSTEKFKVNVFKQRYTGILENCIEKCYGKRYNVIAEIKKEEDINRELDENYQPSSEKLPIKSIASDNPYKEEYYINPSYTFENFVVGQNNNYAHSVALAVAEAPAVTYNPLFIYGGSGLGKTHLMHAIGHYILENSPELKVLYVSSETFTNELVQSLQAGKNSNSKMNSFKEKYRSVDVLLIDDIQFIEGKDSTQIEFFHTFNTLYDLKKQIVISSDRHPSNLKDLDDRLKSRFQWNVIADIQPPDYETRVAILRNKAILEGIKLDDDVLEVIDIIAEKVKFNIRELESALTRTISFSKVFNQKINVKFARENLKDIFSIGDSTISCETVKKAVSKMYNVKLADLESSKRKREFAYPRQIAMYLCRELTDLSLSVIGKSFGGKDHTTVLHACDKISKELRTNTALAEDIRKLKDDIN